MKKRRADPWMPPERFGASLRGVGLNLLVRDIGISVAFARDVLDARIVYDDPDFAVLELSGGCILLHADHTYRDHPFIASVEGVEARGAGVEIRLYDTDPDAIEAAARTAEHVVLAGAMNKPHGLREVYLLDPDGYCWVASRPLSGRRPSRGRVLRKKTPSGW